MASATKTRPAFGQTVTVAARALRETTWNPVADKFGRERRRVWKRAAFKTPRTAIYIGYRPNKSNGEVFSEGLDDGFVNYYKAHENFEMWLVVEGERTNPYFVWPDDCEVS